MAALHVHHTCTSYAYLCAHSFTYIHKHVCIWSPEGRGAGGGRGAPDHIIYIYIYICVCVCVCLCVCAHASTLLQPRNNDYPTSVGSKGPVQLQHETSGMVHASIM